MPLKVYFQKLHPQAQLPTRGSEQAAGYDLKSVEYGTIEPGQTKIVGTGLRMKMEHIHQWVGEAPMKDGFALVAKVMSRSGLAAKFGVCILNAPGIIDQDYRGEIKLILLNTGHKPYHFCAGDRLGQMLFEWVYTPVLEEVTELPPDDTARGARGLGSTGVVS
jgi:dUTP pyrophosphatase